MVFQCTLRLCVERELIGSTHGFSYVLFDCNPVQQEPLLQQLLLAALT
jgi:hypothetical protein